MNLWGRRFVLFFNQYRGINSKTARSQPILARLSLDSAPRRPMREFRLKEVLLLV